LVFWPRPGLKMDTPECFGYSLLVGLVALCMERRFDR